MTTETRNENSNGADVLDMETAADVALDRLTGECARLTAGEVAARLRRYGWDVSHNFGAPDDAPLEDPYTVTRTWSLNGLRGHLAREMFLESLLPAED